MRSTLPLMNLIQRTSPEPQAFSSHGFKIPRPSGEHSARIWQAAETFGKDSNAVSEEKFHAIVALEAEVVALRRAAGTSE